MSTEAIRRSEWGLIRERRGGQSFAVRFVHEGAAVERGGFSTRRSAESARRRARAALESGRPLDRVLVEVFGDRDGAALTFKQASAKYLAAVERTKRTTTLRADVSRLRVAGRAPWAAKMIGAVATSDLARWLEKRREPREDERERKRRPGETLAQYRAARKTPDRMEKVTLPGASVAATNRDLAIVSAVYRWAIKHGLASVSPAEGITAESEKGRGREVYLTAAESRALVESCDAVLRPLVLAALHTGMRRGELLALAWRDVDLKRKELRVQAETEKAGRGRVVPLTPALLATLDALKGERKRPAMDGTDPVFADHEGERLTPAAVRVAWDRTLSRCEGIPLGKRGEVTFHTLRHTAASLMVAAGVPLFDVAKVLGHSTLAVTMRYAHFAPEAGRTALDRLGAALSGAPAAPARASAAG